MEPKYKKLDWTPYEFADVFYRYSQISDTTQKYRTDYGTGEFYTPVEVHTVSLIEENPGITASEIAERSFRTKGAVSQILSKLEEKRLIRKEQDLNNARRYCLYVTPRGLELSYAHKEYDDQHMGSVLEEWISLYGWDAVNKLPKMLDYYIKNIYPRLLSEFQNRKENKEKN